MLLILTNLSIQSVTPSRIQANFQDITLDAEDMSRIKTLEKGLRTCNPPWKVTVFVSRRLSIYLAPAC